MEDVDMFMQAALHEGATRARRKRQRAAWWGGSCRVQELPAAPSGCSHPQPLHFAPGAEQEARMEAYASCVVGADLRGASAKQLQRALNYYADKAERKGQGSASAAAWGVAGGVAVACCMPLVLLASLAIAPVAVAGVAHGVVCARQARAALAKAAYIWLEAQRRGIKVYRRPGSSLVGDVQQAARCKPDSASVLAGAVMLQP